MAFLPYSGALSGIAYFGPAPSDPGLFSNANFTVDAPNSRLVVPNVLLNAGGSINIPNSGMLTFNSNGTIDVNARRLTNLATPTADSDAATKAYVDAARAGLDVKQSVRVATTTNIAPVTNSTNQIQGAVNGTFPVIDGVTLNVNDRILVKDQGDATNGIYYVASVGSAGSQWLLSRTTDADTGGANGEVTAGMFVFVTEGTTNGDTGWVLTTNDTITLNTTTLTFAQFSNAGSFTAGSGIVRNGNTIDVGAGNGITVASDTVAVTDGSGILVNAGGVHANLISYATQTESAVAATSTTSRTYPIQVNSTDQLVVNVPWTDTNSGGTVTSVAALTIGTAGTDIASSVINGSTTPVITLNVPTASSSNRGALSSTDWTTFNNKQNALGSRSGLSILGVSGTASAAVADIIATNTADQVLRVSGGVLGFGTIGTSGIANNAVTNAKFRQSAGLSVVGVTGNSTADVADITASSDGTVLRRSGTSIGFGTINTSGIADASVTEAKLSRSVASVSSSISLTADINLVSTVGSNLTVTLPSVSTVGRMITVKKVDGAAGTVAVTREGTTALIDGAVSKILYYQYESLTCVSNGTNWFII